MLNVNFGAVIVSALLAFIVGRIWYSKKVFGTAWSKHSGLAQGAQAKHKSIVFLISGIFYLISALAFALFLGPIYTLAMALIVGAIIGTLFVATSFGINYLFSGRSMVLLLIDAGYHLVQFLLYGLVFGLWH